MVIKYPVAVRKDGSIQAVILDGTVVTQTEPREGVKRYKERINFENEFQRLIDEVA